MIEKCPIIIQQIAHFNHNSIFYQVQSAPFTELMNVQKQLHYVKRFLNIH